MQRAHVAVETGASSLVGESARLVVGESLRDEDDLVVRIFLVHDPSSSSDPVIRAAEHRDRRAGPSGPKVAKSGRNFLDSNPPPCRDFSPAIPDCRRSPTSKSMHERDELHLLRVEEVARRLNASRTTVYRRIWDGSLPAHRLGDGTKALRVAEHDLRRWLYRIEGSRSGAARATAVEGGHLPTRPRRERDGGPFVGQRTSPPARSEKGQP
jgi:excisionase family DNA binding protein